MATKVPNVVMTTLAISTRSIVEWDYFQHPRVGVVCDRVTQ